MSEETKDADGEPTRASDVPLEIVREREAFVRNVLKKGMEYTEELIHENRELRAELDAMQTQVAELRSQLASDDAIRDFVKTIEKLEAERRALVHRHTVLEETERAHANRQQEIEQEINDLANLYIANFQLHASFSLRRVVRHLCDMVGQLIGAEAFVIYLVQGNEVVPIASEHVPPESLSTFALGSGPVGAACLTGIRRVRENDLSTERADDPVAVIPLMADGRPVGAAEIVRMLEQKQSWASVDHELFELLAAQAGTALIAAALYDPDLGPVASLAGLPARLERKN